MERVAFHAGADAAGEGARHVLVLARDALSHRHHVAHRAVGRVDRAEDVVEERALLEVGVADVGLEREQRARHLDQVVDVARLGRAAVDHVAQLVGLAEVLVAAVPAGGEGVVVHHLVPEELRGRAFALAAGVLVLHQRAEQLGHQRVAVLAGEDVLATRERVDDRLVVEVVRQRQPALVAGVGVEIGEHLVHAAELGGEHPLRLRVVELRDDALDPRRVLDLDVERCAVAREAIRVAQPGEDLVDDVPGGPEAVQVESAGADDAAAQLLEADLAVHAVLVGLRADVAVALFVLHGLQLGDEVVGALLEAVVAGRGVHQADGRQVVARDVAGELAARPVPPAVALGLRLEAGALPEKGHHPVHFEREQVVAVQVLGVLERPAGQPDVGERQRTSLLWHHGLRWRRGLGRRPAAGDEGRRGEDEKIPFHEVLLPADDWRPTPPRRAALRLAPSNVEGLAQGTPSYAEG